MTINYLPSMGKISDNLKKIAELLEKLARPPEPIEAEAKPDQMLETLQAIRVLLEKMSHPTIIVDSDQEALQKRSDTLDKLCGILNSSHAVPRTTGASSTGPGPDAGPEYVMIHPGVELRLRKKASLADTMATILTALPPLEGKLKKIVNGAMKEYTEACE